MKYSESLENLDKFCIYDLFIDLIVIMEKLNDNPCALAIVLQGNHSHDVAGIFGSQENNISDGKRSLFNNTQILNPSIYDVLLLVLTRVPGELVTKNKNCSRFLTGYTLEINWVQHRALRVDNYSTLTDYPCDENFCHDFKMDAS